MCYAHRRHILPFRIRLENIQRKMYRMIYRSFSVGGFLIRYIICLPTSGILNVSLVAELVNVALVLVGKVRAITKPS